MVRKGNGPAGGPNTPRPGPQRKDGTVDSTRSVTAADGILYAGSRLSEYKTRAERALKLYEERDEYPCPDFQFGRGRHACKHLIATALLFASRRSGVKVRTISVAGDPFVAAAGHSRTAECDGCGRTFPIQDLIHLDEDNHHNLTHFNGESLCQQCADAAGVIR
jgi:hypothetical protein